MFKLRKVDTQRFDAEGAGDAEDGVFGLPYGEDEASLVLLPVPWEPTVSYGRGTVHGPELIRRASAQLDLYDPELEDMGMPHPWQYGIAMRATDPLLVQRNAAACALAEPVVVAGGPKTAALQQAVAQVDALCEEVMGSVQQQVRDLLQRRTLCGVLGGDHSVSLGAILAQAEHDPRVGILHIDAHADLRIAYEGFTHSHASVMYNVLARGPKTLSLVQVGIRDLSQGERTMMRDDPRIHGFFDFELRRRLHRGESWAAICDDIVSRLPGRVYISLDIDGLEPMYCPNTGTPVPGGLSFAQVLTLLHSVVEAGKQIVGFDVVEVSAGAAASRGAAEGCDVAADWDGNVGARLVYRLCGLAFVSALRG